MHDLGYQRLKSEAVLKPCPNVLGPLPAQQTHISPVLRLEGWRGGECHFAQASVSVCLSLPVPVPYVYFMAEPSLAVDTSLLLFPAALFSREFLAAKGSFGLSVSSSPLPEG